MEQMKIIVVLSSEVLTHPAFLSLHGACLLERFRKTERAFRKFIGSQTQGHHHCVKIRQIKDIL